MKLEVAMLVGPESKAFLVGIEQAVERLEKVARILRSPGENDGAVEGEEAPKAKRGRPVKAAKTVEEEDAEETETATETEEEEDDFAPKKSAKKASASFDDDEEETEEEEPAPKASTKAKKLTADDVNDAAKERAARTTRVEVLSLLKKHFDVKSISDLEPTDYAACIKVLAKK